MARRRVVIQPALDPHLGLQEGSVRHSVLIEPVNEAGFEGYYYAHVPSLDLTTHGQGIEGALQAARELVEAWVAEKPAHGEAVSMP